MGPRSRQAARLGVALASLAACARENNSAPVYPQGVGCAVPSRPTENPDASAPSAVEPVTAANPAPAPTEAPHAITAALPALQVDNLRRFHDFQECARGECRIEGFAPTAPGVVASDDGAVSLPPVSGWVQVIRPGATVIQPRRTAVDLLGVVLAGTAQLRKTEAPTAAPERATPWTAFVLPEGGALLRADGSAPVAIFLTVATANAASIGDVVTGNAPRSRGGYVLRPFESVEDLAWGNGAMHARIGFEAAQSPHASLGVLIASDNAPVPEHTHPGTWEMLTALSASGRLHIPAQRVDGVNDAMTARERTVTGGTIAYVPAGVRHGWAPDGTHPLIAIQVYSPPGPEQRFRALAHPTNETAAPSGAPAR